MFIFPPSLLAFSIIFYSGIDEALVDGTNLRPHSFDVSVGVISFPRDLIVFDSVVIAFVIHYESIHMP